MDDYQPMSQEKFLRLHVMSLYSESLRDDIQFILSSKMVAFRKRIQLIKKLIEDDLTLSYHMINIDLRPSVIRNLVKKFFKW